MIRTRIGRTLRPSCSKCYSYFDSLRYSTTSNYDNIQVNVIDKPFYRSYYYFLNSRGQLFLADAKYKNFATSLKDKTFLNFFYKQLQPISLKNVIKEATDNHFTKENPRFVSPCGKELNYLIVDDKHAAIVFNDISETADDIVLMIGQSNLIHEFDPSYLKICPESGRLYHQIIGHKHLRGFYGLLHPDLMAKLSQSIVFVGADNISMSWKGIRYDLSAINNPTHDSLK